jgi:hypothetical protein
VHILWIFIRTSAHALNFYSNKCTFCEVLFQQVLFSEVLFQQALFSEVLFQPVLFSEVLSSLYKNTNHLLLVLKFIKDH